MIFIQTKEQEVDFITAQQYQAWSQPIRQNPTAMRIFRIVNIVLPRIPYIAYPLLLLWLFLQHDARFVRVLVVPGISFVLLSLFRDKFNAPRPYEALTIDPLIHKDTKGHSFPSRHVFSFAVIACAFWYLNRIIGIIFMCGSVLMAIIRVLGGVHFPKDVIAGFIIGIICGMIGFVLL